MHTLGTTSKPTELQKGALQNYSADRSIDLTDLRLSDGTHQSSFISAEPNLWWRLSFASTKFINMVSVFGNFYPCAMSENVEIWVGDYLTPTNFGYFEELGE